jgi:hypothetical protein
VEALEPDARGGERTHENARARGRKCGMKATDTQVFSQVAGQVRAHIMKKAHPKPNWYAVVDGLMDIVGSVGR